MISFFKNKYQKYPRHIGAILISVSIFLSTPMILVIFVAGLIVVFEPEKLTLSQSMVFVWESFVIYYMLSIPAIVLFVLGIISLKKCL